jgi:hypothetical protein
MTNIIEATFITRRPEDSGSDNTLDYYVYVFSEIIDSDGIRYSDKWIKETKLMKAVPFQKGIKYQITLNHKPYSLDAINLPYPVEIAWNKGKVYMKNGNSIISVDGKGKEINLSRSPAKADDINNYTKAALNKFNKGLMTAELLEKMNLRGVHFYVNYIDLQDKRSSSTYGVGYITRSNEMNRIIVKQETKEKVKQALEEIKQRWVPKSIEGYFTITTELLEPKKRR